MSQKSRSRINPNDSYYQDANADKNVKALSSDELKSKLLQVVKNKGIFDSMKSQLRNKLVLELNPNLDQIKSKANELALNQKIKSNLALNTINSLILNHLKANEYDYTLSVFMPETGLALNDSYSLNDVLHILKISPDSNLFQQLNNTEAIKSKGLLWYLVSYFCSHYVTHNASTQTESYDLSNMTSSLDFKLKNLDKYYVDMNENLNSKLSFEEKIVNYQKRLDEKSKIELAEKLKEFKEIELARMRVEEREKIRHEMQEFRSELENSYQKRMDSLNQREQSFDDLMKQKREMEEREIFLQRQHLLDEIKQLREKETDFKRSIESQTKFMNMDSNKFEKLEQDLRKRETDLKTAQENFDNLLRSEREKLRADLERSYSQREFILSSIDAKNKQDASQNEIERAHLDRIKHEYQTMQIRLNEIDLELKKSLGETACLTQENTLLKEKLSHCMDYDFIVQENKMLKYKLDVSKELIGEKNLTSRRSATARQSARSIPQRKRSVTFENNGDILKSNEPGLVPLLELNNDNDKTEMEQEQFDDEDMNKETFREEGDRVLSEAIERSELKDKLEHHNLVNSELKDLYEMQLYEQRKLYETVNDVRQQVEFLFNGIATSDEFPTKAKEASQVNLSLDFIDNAKDRLKYLESESERVEHSYRNYQHKIKSKYYPINDDEEKEIRLVTRGKSEFESAFDIDKFFESTVKAEMRAKVMREQIIGEIDDYTEKKSIKENQLAEKKLDELLDNVVPTFKLKESIRPSDEERSKEIESIKKQLIQDQNDLKYILKKQDSLLSDDLTTSKSAHDLVLKRNDSSKELYQSNKVNFLDADDDDQTFNSESKKVTDKSNSKIMDNVSNNNNFGVNDYVKMLKDKMEDSDDEKAKKKVPERRIKIEYSESSTSSSSSSRAASDDDDKKFTFKKDDTKIEKNTNDDDDDDDFKW